MSDVKITIGNGNLGRASQSLDGVCALIGTGVSVSGKFALGDVLALRSIADAENLGITAAYDTTNKSLLHAHISAFYANAGEGAELYVMPVANTVTMAQMLDKTLTHAPVLLDGLKGRVRMLAISRTPATAYSAEAVNQFDPDVWAAAAKAQELYASEFLLHRPIQIFIEGRGFAGTAASAKDLRNASTGLNANRVSIVCGADNAISALFTEALTYAAVTVPLGRAAAIPVQRNIGRVKDGAIALTGEAGMSDGTKLSTFTGVELAALDTFGYVFVIQRDGKAGYFLNNDHCACKIDDDYAYIHRGRPIDKAARIVRETYLEELLDDVEVDAGTGKLAASVVKHYQRAGEKAIEVNMLAGGEISGVSVFVDPDQNILSTDQITTVMRIVPKGMVNAIEVLLSYSNPSSN